MNRTSGRGHVLAALLARRHVGQQRERHDPHVERDDGRGNRRAEAEAEDDVDPDPPGDRPRQQAGRAGSAGRRTRRPRRGRPGGSWRRSRRRGVAAGAGAPAGAAARLPVKWCVVCSVTVGVPPSDWRHAITQRISLSVRPIGGLLIVGMPGVKPGTMNAFGSYSVCGEVLDVAHARLRGSWRGSATPARSGKRSAPGLADRVAGEAEPLALHDRPADLGHLGRASCRRAGWSSVGGCTSFCGTIWPT